MDKGYKNDGHCPECGGLLHKSPSTDLLKCPSCHVTWYPRVDGRIGLWDRTKPKGGVNDTGEERKR